MSTPSKTFKIGGELEVNRLGFGAMRLTGNGIWGEPKDVDEAKRVLKRAVELGVNFIDTADSYGPAVSERLIGEALSPFAKGLVVATKGGLTRQGPDQWLPVGRPEYLAQQAEMSLHFLKTEVIDLWQLHRIDPQVPVEESLRVIAKLQQEGKIRHVGLSEVKPAAIAQRHGATVAPLSIAWLLHRSSVVLPIPGTSSVAHLEENLKAAEIFLSDAELKEIESSCYL
jgi:pyridoxine 4-dehydrogenase